MAVGDAKEAVTVTRIACFKFKTCVSGAEKGGRTRACVVLALYDEYAHLLASPPRGGRPLETKLELTGVEREEGWDTGFVVRFKSEAARVEFDRAEGHERLKGETDPLLERVFVYDFVEQEGLGW
ncbi:hypothetical protein P171DRAFT_520812 [Karstenula rhodostoma CBS 690.94]|uniref:Stress-response A/B barrel domain-containing protein n=1 Tax=Karstenula rhodostoma CBS 690.94 TaxID=1392251 RepID=A0A9P4PIB4_9PLEO|nr:hypothetical protein P171DRAFT_520812 [Karstenula rhodostoma CBS 690.94]